MTITVNGEARDVPDPTTVSALLDLLDMPHRDRGVAVAVDSTVIPRGAWDEHHIAAGARVEVLVAVQGG